MSQTPFIDPSEQAADRLNQRHINSILADKRATYRQRTYLIAGSITTVVGAIQSLLWGTQAAIASVAILSVITYYLIAVGLIACSIWLIRRAIKLTRETFLVASPPVELPDFATLSDGSQFASNLEHIEDDE